MNRTIALLHSQLNYHTFPITPFKEKKNNYGGKSVELTGSFRFFCHTGLVVLSSFSISTLPYLLYINLACLFVCLCPINVKTTEPIGPKFFVGHLGTPGKVYESSKFQIFVSIKIRSSLNFWKFWKSAKFFVKIRELFLFCFTMYTKRTCSQLI